MIKMMCGGHDDDTGNNGDVNIRNAKLSKEQTRTLESSLRGLGKPYGALLRML